MKSGFLRSASVLTVSNIGTLAATFLRGVILARSLDPTEFGLALLLITISIGLDVMQDGGIDQLIVQSKHGTRREIVAAAQAYRIAGALIAAMALFFLAGPIANLLNTPELAGSIRILAIIPLLRSTVNLSYKKQQRDRIYTQEAAIDLSRCILETVVLFVALQYYPVHWAVIFGLVTNAFLHTFLSNVVFGENWLAPLRKRAMRIVGAFALPVTVNSFLLFATMQGDRLIIANVLNPAQVAIYASAAAFGQAGTTFLGRITASLSISHFGAGQFRHSAVQAKAQKVHLYFLGFSTAVGIGLALIVPFLVALVYGEAYGGQFSLIAVLSCVNAVQIEQGLLTPLLTSAGRTRIFPLLTTVRASSIPLGFAALSFGLPLESVAVATLAGTFLAALLSYRELAKLRLISAKGLWLGTARGCAALLVGGLVLLS